MEEVNVQVVEETYQGASTMRGPQQFYDLTCPQKRESFCEQEKKNKVTSKC